MPSQISPMLAVTDGSAAIAFYKAGFGAEVLWQPGTGADIVAGLAIDGAPFFLAFEASAYGTRGPSDIRFTMVRTELFVKGSYRRTATRIGGGPPNTAR